MREKLLKSIEKLCWLYPQLKPRIGYSEVLSQDEVDAFGSFSGDGEHHVKSNKLASISREGLDYVSSLLAISCGRDTSLSSSSVDFLRANPGVAGVLRSARDKVVKHNLVGSCPLSVEKPSLLKGFFAPNTHRFDEFHKMLRASILHVLEKNDIVFDSDTNQGVAAYFHEELVGSKVCFYHYVGENKKHLELAQELRIVLSRYPRSAVIPFVKKLADSDFTVV